MEYPLDNPQQLVITYELTKFRIDNIRIVPFINASMSVQLLTEDGQVGKGLYLVMEGEDYQKWNGSDEYLIWWVKQQIISQ